MIANARMYSVTPAVAELWHELLTAVIAKSGVSVALIEHEPPRPIDELWQRTDMGAVFMCGLPFSRAEPQPNLVAAPVPSPSEFNDGPTYWSELVVRADSSHRTVTDTFGGRLALTVPGSQSGCLAALSHFLPLHASLAVASPLYGQIIEPTVTPLGALTAVADGAADLAPIDGYAWRLIQLHRPDVAASVRSVGRTAATPIPPLVASPRGRGTDDSQRARHALSSAFLGIHEDMAYRHLLDRLLLRRFTQPDPRNYAVLETRAEHAQRHWRKHPLAARTHPAFAF